LNAIQSAPEAGKFWIDLPDHFPDFDVLPNYTIENGNSRQVPLPQTKQDFTKYVTVLASDESGGPEVFKFTLSDFPPPGFLSNVDMGVWKKWLSSEPVQFFLDIRMAECFDQVAYFDRLKVLGLVKISDSAQFANQPGTFDLFLEREPVEEKKLRHARLLSRSEGYLSQLKTMQVKDPLAQITWVDLLMEEFTILKYWQDGEKFFHDQYSANPEQIEFHIASLNCIYEQGRYDDLERILWDAVGRSPQKTEYWNLLIKKYIDQQALGKALEITNMALSINPDNKELVENKFFVETAIRKSERK
jgi:hypothetical protein